MQSLKGKRVLVTGASAGIGKATAELLARAGATVFGMARRADRLESLESEGVIPVVGDIRGDLSCLNQFEAEPLDVLINNAGLARGRASLLETDPQDMHEMIDTNVRALISVTRKVIPGMIQRGRGDIVNIGSIAGLFTYAGGSVYCATKFAVHALSDSWRHDLLGKGIRVMEICPGMVETEFSQVRFRGNEVLAKKTYEGMLPLKADDIAEAILWSLTRPSHVNIHQLVIMPTDQSGVGQVYRRPSAGR